MRYFRDLEFVSFARVPQCSVWIDRRFDHYWALNFAASGRIGYAAGPAGPAAERVVTLDAPVAWWTWPGSHFRYGCDPGASWDQRFVTFYGPRARRIFAEGLAPTPPAGRPFVQPVPDPEGFAREWDALFALLDARGRRDNPDAVHRLEGMLLRLRPRRAPDPSPPRETGDGSAEGTWGDTAAAALAAAIRVAPEREWDWEAEARARAVSLVHLRRRFREEIGVPPHRFLLQARMEAAARLLLASDLPARAVGEAVGVGDPFYFSKLFKAHFGLPPDHFRREARPYASAAGPRSGA